MIMGINCIKKFNLTTFDYENKEIRFYSNNVIINNIGEERKIINNMFLVIIFVCIIGLLIQKVNSILTIIK